MDFLRNDGQSADNRRTIVTLPSVNPLCVSHRIDTWQIVYLSYKDPCPKHQFNKVILRYINVPWTPMDNDGTCAKFTSLSIQHGLYPSGTNLQLAAETCELAQVPSLSMSVHGTLM